MDRRRFLHAGAVATAAAASGVASPVTSAAASAASAASRASAMSAAFRHSVCRWPFARLPLDALCREAARLGLASVELLEPDEWAVARAHGLTCAMGYAPAGDPRARLTVGWNRESHHAWLLPAYERGLALAAAAGVPNVICFSGNRAGLADAAGLDACARGLRQLMPTAERLNSKVDHADYQCDRTRWGADLVERVGSPRFRLLYDVYHMQIMEGDVIRTIREHGARIAHYHVAGVPGRHEPDATQELHYPAILRALAETGFAGHVAQEFVPTGEPLAALAAAVRICRV